MYYWSYLLSTLLPSCTLQCPVIQLAGTAVANRIKLSSYGGGIKHAIRMQPWSRDLDNPITVCVLATLTLWFIWKGTSQRSFQTAYTFYNIRNFVSYMVFLVPCLGNIPDKLSQIRNQSPSCLKG
jgi:hypothetical protein